MNMHRFTLGELVFSLVLILTLGGFVFAAAEKAQEQSDSANCSENLRLMSLGAKAYAKRHGGTYMTGGFDCDGNKKWNWWGAELGIVMKKWTASSAKKSWMGDKVFRCDVQEANGYDKLAVGPNFNYAYQRCLEPNHTFMGKKVPKPSMMKNPEELIVFCDGAPNPKSKTKTVLFVISWEFERNGGFCHNGGKEMNAAFLDGHVGSIQKAASGDSIPQENFVCGRLSKK